MSALLANLNDEQLAAVTHGEGPLMIIAGAGTGKTTVITKRIGWLIEQGKAKPEEILALTFTDKSAGEMEERVDRLLPLGYVDLSISTFHAFCERVLREHALDIGLPHEFKLLNEIGAYVLVRKNFERFKLDYYRPRGNPTKFIGAMLKHFSRAKDELVTPDKYLAFAEARVADVGSMPDAAQEEQKQLSELASAFHAYQKLLLDEGVLDFADLISYTIELFKTRPNVLAEYRARYKYILVDEFQDTNGAQYELVKLLAAPQNNLTIVGDDDQSIYRFRGASLQNILRFREDFQDAKRVVLNHNYRSTPAVLERAYDLIQRNNPNRLEAREQLDKKLISHHEHLGAVEHVHVATSEEEVKAVLERMIALKAEHGCEWGDFCILVRANDHADPFVASMERAGIPYRFFAMRGLYGKPTALDLLSIMRAIDFPHDSPAVYRYLSHPTLGIPATDVAMLNLYARRKGRSLFEAVRDYALVGSLSEEGRKRLEEMLRSITTWRELARRSPVTELFARVVRESGVLGDAVAQDELEKQERIGHLNQLYERLKRFEETADDRTLHSFLIELEAEKEAGESGALSVDLEGGPDVVSVMTVHGSKGLEFRFVFIVNMVEQRFPSTARGEALPLPEGLIENIAGDHDHHEEERRLFYVALTRAKEGAYLFSADSYGGTRKRKPSRFIAEAGIVDGSGLTGSCPVSPQDPQASFAVSGSPKPATRVATLSPAPPTRLSFTQLAAFSTCPLQYKFAHIVKIPVFGRHSMSFGKTMHNTLQVFMANLLVQRDSPQASLFEAEPSKPIVLPPLSELLSIYDRAWIDEWYPDEAIKNEYKKKGKESLMQIHNSLSEHMPRVAYIEKGFTLKVGEVTVKGRIDRMDEFEDGIEIIDYKTGTPKEKLGWEDRRQLLLYALAGEQSFSPPLNVKKLTYHYLENNSAVSFEPKQKDKEKLQEEILDTYQALKSSDFTATPGFHCRYCDFKDICESAEL